MAFGPRQVNWQDIGINTLGASIAWFIWSIIILLIVVSISSVISVPETFKNARLAGGVTNPMFPFILSFITFIAVMVTSLISAKLLQMTDGEKYKARTEIYGQIGFLWILMYICLTPIYIYIWVQDYDYIMIVFIIHVLSFSFWSSLILELLNSYRYVLIWLYGNFLALFEQEEKELLKEEEEKNSI